jgi:phosphatidylinositol 4-kinase
MGALLAGIGQPLVTKPVGSVAIAQGRKARALTFNSVDASVISRRNTMDEDTFHQRLALHSSSQPHLPLKKSRPSSASSAFSAAILGDSNSFTVSLEDLHKGKAFSVSRYLKKAQQKINHTVRSTLVSHDANAPPQLLAGMHSASMKAMAQSSVPVASTSSAPSTPTTPTAIASPCRSFSSSEEVLGQSPPASPMEIQMKQQQEEDDLVNNTSESDDDEVYALAKLSLDDRRQLLRSNYFRSEMQFLLALVDIATRLVIVPKPARLSALHAELTLLNHNLPAEICMPLWCPATTERPYHHRIVRISPTDAVVLNSAERVSKSAISHDKITHLN